MSFTLFLMKLVYLVAGFCLGLEFMGKGLKNKNRQLFFEGFGILIIFSSRL